MGAIVVDFQAFKSLDNQFIVKELAIVRVDCENYASYLFRPPQPFHKLSPLMKQRVNFLTRTIHGLRWDSGCYDYNAFTTILSSHSANIIYVKGSERANFIRKILRTIYKDDRVILLHYSSIRIRPGCLYMFYIAHNPFSFFYEMNNQQQQHHHHHQNHHQL